MVFEGVWGPGQLTLITHKKISNRRGCRVYQRYLITHLVLSRLILWDWCFRANEEWCVLGALCHAVCEVTLCSVHQPVHGCSPEKHVDIFDHKPKV